MQPQKWTGLVLRGCWLPGTGSVPFSSSPSYTSLTHITFLSPTALDSSWSLLNAALTLSISPSNACVCCHLSNLPLWCCSCHLLPTASPFSTPQLQGQSQSYYVQVILFSRSHREQNQTGKWWKTVPHAANLTYHISNAGIKNMKIIIDSLLSHLVAP